MGLWKKGMQVRDPGVSVVKEWRGYGGGGRRPDSSAQCLYIQGVCKKINIKIWGKTMNELYIKFFRN